MKKSKIVVPVVIAIVVLAIVGIVLLTGNDKSSNNLEQQEPPKMTEQEKNNLKNEIEYRLNNEGGMGYVENIIHNSTFDINNIDIIWEYTDGGKNIKNISNMEIFRITQDNNIKNIDNYIKDAEGNILSFNESLQNYMKSDNFRNTKIGYDKRYKEYSEDIEELKNNQDLITEEYKSKYNDVIQIWDIYSKEYELYKSYVENPTEYDYQAFKNNMEQIENEMKTCEAYKNYELHLKYPNLY